MSEAPDSSPADPAADPGAGPRAHPPTSAATGDTTPQAPDWRRGRSLANGVELAWEECGSAQGEPLLLLTGMSWQLIHWPEALCAGLAARGFRVIRYDHRDAGLSGSVNHGVRIQLVRANLRSRAGLPVMSNYRLYDLAADALGLMDALQLQRAHLVGMSMGGMIAQIVAGQAPSRVLSLCSIMSSPNHPWWHGPTLPVLRRVLARPPDHQRETVVAHNLRTLQLIGSPRYPSAEAQLRQLAERAYDRAFRPAGVLRQMQAIIATGSIEALLPQIQAPTQIIHGSADRMVRPGGGRRSARQIRDARLELIDGMGHDLPEALLPRIQTLIAANAGR